jgi:hypothetical protein
VIGNVALRSALGGTPEGRPAQMQSCGKRRAATIGVIQKSLKRSPLRAPQNAKAIVG